jgi:glycosyltransferase involved in cell wall biosynthesis
MPDTTRRSRQQAESADLELSVVIPSLNEAPTNGICVEKAQRALRENRVAGEIVVANNGGTDGSQDIAISGGADHSPSRRSNIPCPASEDLPRRLAHASPK